LSHHIGFFIYNIRIILGMSIPSAVNGDGERYLGFFKRIFERH
jgi:hypothetical protein